MPSIRPSFSAAWSRFLQVNINVNRVGDLIGGNVGINIKSGIFTNACPIRMSYVLNYTGFLIPSSSRYATVSGKDKKQYIYRVNDMMDFLVRLFGKPDFTEKLPHPNVFSGK